MFTALLWVYDSVRREWQLVLSARILVVDDEPKFARFLEMELTYEGYEVAKAFDGRVGLQLAETGEFDLVLLDIMLPGLNGMEVLRRIRRVSQVPVIMLTARDSVIDKVSGLDQGADDYITKPFAIEELLARIRTALRKTAARSAPQNALVLGRRCSTRRAKAHCDCERNSRGVDQARV